MLRKKREIFSPDPKKIDFFLIIYIDHPIKNFHRKIIILEVIGIFAKIRGVLMFFYFHILKMCFNVFFQLQLYSTIFEISGLILQFPPLSFRTFPNNLH